MANEKRLIDADKIYDAVERRYQASSGIEHRCERDLLDLICAADTVDAVEVVRCKDCHWWRLVNKRNGCGICSHEVFSIDDCTVDPITEPNDFCSYGERRTDG